VKSAVKGELEQFVEGKKSKTAGILGKKAKKFLKKILSGKNFLILIFIIIFIIALFSFASFEFIGNEEVRQQFLEESKNPFFEAAYWLVTTISTVGYGDYSPTSGKGKILTMIVMVLGVAMLGFFMSLVTQSVVKSNIGDMLGISKTTEKINYILCGWNSVAESALKELASDTEKSIVIVDKGNRPLQTHKENINYVKGDPTKEQTLEKANIKGAENIVLCMENDSDVLLSIHIIRELNPFINIVAKVNTNEHIALVEDAGADHVVSPSSIGGRLLSIASEEPYIVKWLLTATTQLKGIELTERNITKKSPYLGKTVDELKKAFAGKARIIGVDTKDGFVKLPDHGLKLNNGDKLVMVIDKKKME